MGLYALTLCYWVRFLFTEDFVLAPFTTETDTRMLESLREVFSNNHTIPNLIGLTLEYDTSLDLFLFSLSFKKEPSVWGVASLLGFPTLKASKAMMKIFMTLGFYDTMKSSEFPVDIRGYSGDDIHLISDIEHLWNNFIQEKRAIKTLKQLCIRKIRESLSPITADKMQEAGIVGIYSDLVSRKHLAEDIIRVVREFHKKD